MEGKEHTNKLNALFLIIKYLLKCKMANNIVKCDDVKIGSFFNLCIQNDVFIFFEFSRNTLIYYAD